jgi:CRISPR-associated endoribonuclease Cas6
MDAYWEIIFTVIYKEDIAFKRVQEAIANFISSAMLADDKLKALHPQNRFKFYTFSSPHPIEQDKVYHSGRVYVINLRTPNADFAETLKAHIHTIQGPFKVLAAELRLYRRKPISELLTLTPVISTVNNKCWVRSDGIGLLAERLHSNAVKKKKTLDDSFKEPPEHFFDRIELLNEKPIIVTYKNSVLLGHKLRIYIKPHEWAQELASTVLASGILEKNAIGFGYAIIDNKR